MDKIKVFVWDLKPGDQVFTSRGLSLGRVTQIKSTMLYCNDEGGNEQGYAIKSDTRIYRLPSVPEFKPLSMDE